MLKSLKSYSHEYFERVVFDWSIKNPDLGYQNVVSVVACAMMCINKCSTIVALSDEEILTCLLSRRKGSCMEKDEALPYPGARMYQKKVISLSCVVRKTCYQ
jgi:hypothetical protein